MKTILITGGAGFLGSHLCRRLIKDNIVVCVDNLITGDLNNIKDLRKIKKFFFIKHDIVNPLINKVKKFKFDQIYNLACPASPPFYQIDPIHTLKTSVIGCLNLLEIAKRDNSILLQASTSEVYGNPIVHPQPETYFGNVNPDGIRACYDEGKRAAETLLFDFYRTKKVQIRVVRIFNTYGPYMNKKDGRVVSNFIVSALLNKNIEIYGDGSQTRSFCYVDDLINGMIIMMNNKKNFVGPVNLGNPSEFTIKELAEIIVKLTNSKSKIIYKDLPADDPTKRKPIIKLAINNLGWEPQTSLKEGLIKTIDYFKNFLFDE